MFLIFVKITPWRRNGLVRYVCLTTLSSSGYVASKGVIGRVMHFKGYGRRRSWSNVSYHFGICSGVVVENHKKSSGWVFFGPTFEPRTFLLYRSSATLSTVTIDEDDIKMRFGETDLREMDLGGSGSCPVLMTFLSSWFQKTSTSPFNNSANICLLNSHIPLFRYVLVPEVLRTGVMRKIAVWDAMFCTPVDLRTFQRDLLPPIIDLENRDSRFLKHVFFRSTCCHAVLL